MYCEKRYLFGINGNIIPRSIFLGWMRNSVHVVVQIWWSNNGSRVHVTNLILYYTWQWGKEKWKNCEWNLIIQCSKLCNFSFLFSNKDAWKPLQVSNILQIVGRKMHWMNLWHLKVHFYVLELKSKFSHHNSLQVVCFLCQWNCHYVSFLSPTLMSNLLSRQR